MSKIDRNGKITITGPEGDSFVLQQARIKNQSSSKYNGKSDSGLFKIITLFLVIIVFVGFLRTGTPGDITFKGLIEFLANAPTFDISWSFIDFTIYADWGFFNFARDYINFFTDIWEVLLSLFSMLIETLEFIYYIVKGLFFG